MLIYCVLFALVPVVAWLTARRVSTFERRLVAAVMVVVPTGLIVFVMVITSHGKGATAALSAEDAPNSTASWSIGPLLELDTGPAAVTPTVEASVAPPPAPGEVHPSASGGRPDAKSEKKPGSTAPGFAPPPPAEPVGVILPPVTIPSSAGPRTLPAVTVPPVTVPAITTPPRPSPPAGPTTTPPIIEPTTPVTTPPRTTPPVTTSAAPAPTTNPPVTTEPPVTEPTSAGPTTVIDPVTTAVSDLLSASAFLSSTASQSA
ncbi:hypothetical protein I6A60_07720 [Frankia sp. AgB1.9]|uniref:hypothetical protein n=1 Tax=unclassified Frankia TaxID=2632575 RepID=UPI00193410D1|nr:MULTISPECIES: hypothetical protein [unclassified Frankia]MBL7489510.1 hypothetical protein [Frankia sp. AgW1.1]MBL7547760.1 hypothetical protein [Frankia sp. AgB1.9]